MIYLKRIYEEPRKEDGFRILIDRLWPRGVSKEKAQLGLWLKEIAPSAELRKWFGHDPEKWKEFRERYTYELKGNEALKKLKELTGKYETITLLYGAKDEKHNDAVALLDLLKKSKD